MKKEIDGIIEAVRCKNGQVVSARIYERRGATYTDRMVLDRKSLSERLQGGLNYVVGARKEFYANMFEVGKAVMLIKRDGREIIATDEKASHDDIEGALFY